MVNYTITIPVGPISNDDDAKTKCPIACAAHLGTWNGQWKPVIEGEMSVCECVVSYPPAGSQPFKTFVPAGPIWSNDDAQTKGPIVAASYGGRWTGQWTTVIEGAMSVIEVEFSGRPAVSPQPETSIVALYVQGDIYPADGNDPAGVVAAITGSQLTTPILGLFHVNCTTATCPTGGSANAEDADLTFNRALIVRGGQYVGDPTWPAIVQSLRSGQVTKIFASFGGGGVLDFTRIGSLMAKYGTGPSSPLYQNFVCLKETLGIDGVDFDNEDNFDQPTIVEFANMLLLMGLEVTFCPFGDKSFWSGCVKALGASRVSWLNLQCYAGGKGNDPGHWTDMGVPVVAGVCANCGNPQTTCSSQDVQKLYSLWMTGQGQVSQDCWSGTSSGPVDLAGGFIWTYHEIENDFEAYINAMAAGLQAGSGS